MFINQLEPVKKAEVRNAIYQKLKALGFTGEELNEAYENACDSKLTDVQELLSQEIERPCEVCGVEVVAGYIVLDEYYYCSEKHLHQHHSPEVYQDMYESDDAYYTVWDE